MKTYECHFTTQLRVYEGEHDAKAVVCSANVISGLTVNAGHKNADLEVYGSTDGENWTLIDTVSVIPTYLDYEVAIDAADGYTYLKFDAVSAQVRIPSMSLTFVNSSAGETPEEPDSDTPTNSGENTPETPENPEENNSGDNATSDVNGSESDENSGFAALAGCTSSMGVSMMGIGLLTVCGAALVVKRKTELDE